MEKLSDNTKWIFTNEVQPGDTILIGDWIMEIATISPEREPALKNVE